MILEQYSNTIITTFKRDNTTMAQEDDLRALGKIMDFM